MEIFRTALMYLIILLAVRILGKRQISQLQTSELVVTLLISELAVMPIQQWEQSMWTGIVPIGALVLSELLLTVLMLKSGWVRKLVCGRPVMVIENGKILQQQMRKLRMSTEDLYIQLRQNGVFHLDEVAYAIIETNGAMSVSRHAKYDNLTPRQAGVKVKPNLLEVVVVSDGEISKGSVQLCGKDDDWVRQQVKDAGFKLSEVFLMTASADGKFTIVPREKG